MTQYMLGVHHTGPDDEAFQWSDEEMQAAFEAVDAFNKDITESGIWVFGGGLEMPDTATVVRVKDGETVMTDGPFIETKEFLGGFWVVELPDLDAALKLAERASAACRGAVEVRPFQSEPPAE
ncbi:MAG: YciI family protein [Actinomycetota bacterium]|jgi:hypothetical protein|nr:YciI family protein [Actinomycetota bacterium]